MFILKWHGSCKAARPMQRCLCEVLVMHLIMRLRRIFYLNLCPQPGDLSEYPMQIQKSIGQPSVSLIVDNLWKFR